MGLISGGGGGAAFNGGVITNGLEIDSDTESLRLRNGAATLTYLQVNKNSGFAFAATPATGRSALNISNTTFTYVDELGNTILDIEGGYVLLGPAGEVYTNPQGYLVLTNHTIPASADLSAGECALWFDQTNGVGNTKLMVKAKSADGTVKTASIVLA